MLRWRPAWSVLLLLSLLLPATAGAFATREEPLALAYGRGSTPAVFATGALRVEGGLEGGYLASDVRDLALRGVPDLTVTERQGGALPRNETFRNVDVVVHGGSVLWSFGAGDRLDLDLEADYGIALALPHVPLGGADAGAGIVLAGPGLGGALSWRGGEGRIVLLDAEVSLLDAQGAPLAGWDRRAVNRDARAASGPDAVETLLTVSGAFRGDADARIQGGALGASDALSLSVAPSARDRFAETLDVLSHATALLGDEGESAFGRDSPLRNLASFSGVLDGALLVLGDTPGAGGEAVQPLESRMGDAPFEASPMALVRGDPMTLAWDDERMAIQGTPVLAISGAGFAVDEPATVGGLVPLVAVLLWLVAGAAAVVFFVKRPPKGDARWSLRLVSAALHVLVLLVVFWLWDASFARTFGTSALTLLLDGAALDDPARLGVVLSLELAPWGLAALLFALPVRIALGVGLRYLGKGTSYKGIAKAGGLVALGLLGPVYALWLVNAVVSRAFEHLPSMLP